MNSPDPALVEYIQRRLHRTRHRDAERHTLARREASRIRAAAYALAPCDDCRDSDLTPQPAVPGTYYCPDHHHARSLLADMDADR
jgi:hypothetical protein